MDLIVVVITFLLVLLVLELFIYAIYLYRYPDLKKIRRRLIDLAGIADFEVVGDITRKRVLSEIPLLNKVLQKVPAIERLDRLVLQANTALPLGFFFVTSFSAGTIVFMVLGQFTHSVVAGLFAGLLSGALPWMYLIFKRRRWVKRFREQLPDAMDLIARSLRAGHAFTMGMKYASEEYGDPLGPEFQHTLEEVNFGLSVVQALKNLAARVGCEELSFFCVSVILQRETGGNLSDVLEQLSHIIRERFKLHGKIKALSAEGRLTAYILFAIPIFIVGAVYTINPEMMRPLWEDPIGRMMSMMSVASMVIGFFIIKKMIRFDI